MKILIKIKLDKNIKDIKWKWANEFHLKWKLYRIRTEGLNNYIHNLDVGSIWVMNNFYEVGLNFKNKVFVDIGCGIRGFCAIVKAKKKIGIDPIINEVNKVISLSKEVEYMSDKGESINLPNDFADVVVCHNTLNHTDNPEMVLKEIYRILRKEGIFLFQILIQEKSLSHTYNFNEIVDFLFKYFEPVKIKRDKVLNYNKLFQYGGIFKKNREIKIHEVLKYDI